VTKSLFEDENAKSINFMYHTSEGSSFELYEGLKTEFRLLKITLDSETACILNGRAENSKSICLCNSISKISFKQRSYMVTVEFIPLETLTIKCEIEYSLYETLNSVLWTFGKPHAKKFTVQLHGA
jgi:hypothetical protein